MPKELLRAISKAADTPQPLSTTVFYIPKGRLATLMGGVQRMQQREDISGKFARKLGRQRRALLKALEDAQAEQDDLLDRHKERYPAGHALKGEVVPVYLEENGKPVFKKDDAGNDTEERITVPNSHRLIDPAAYERDMREFLREVTVVECPAFLVADPTGRDQNFVPELDVYKAVHGAAFDACMDLEEDAPTTVAPIPTGMDPFDDDDDVRAAKATDEDRSAP